MSVQYKENNFSTENRSASHTITQNNKDKITKPNIDHLIKRILDERRRKKRNSKVLGFSFLSIILAFYLFQN